NVCETYCNVEKGEWEFTEEFDSVSEEAKDFVSRLIVYEKKKRMLPKECLAHPWIAKHRAKANIDTILEKPAEGPVMDKKQMMRYNAKRKFRRLITYVKIFIELSRLRRTANCRMSQSGQKYFETLLIAAEQEKQLAQQNIAKASANEAAQELPEKGVDEVRPNKLEMASTSKDIGQKENKTSAKKIGGTPSVEKVKKNKPKEEKAEEPVEKKTASTSKDIGQKENKTFAKKIGGTPSVEKVKKNKPKEEKTEEPVEKKATTEMPRQKRSWEKTDPNEYFAAKPPHPAAHPAVKIAPPAEEKKEKMEPEKKALQEKKIPEVVVEVPLKKTVRTKSPSLVKAPTLDFAGPALPTENVPSKLHTKKPQETPLRKSASTERASLIKEKGEKAERRSLREKKHLPTGSAASDVKPKEALKIEKTFEKTKANASLAETAKDTPKTGNSSVMQISEKLQIKETSLEKLGSKNHDSTSERIAKNLPRIAVEEPTSLRLRKSSAPEAIITEPPKKTVLGSPKMAPCGENRSTPMRMQRFGNTAHINGEEGGRSGKEVD
ncbi:unnamed protein product, partial [Strongylus vulgaris]